MCTVQLETKMYVVDFGLIKDKSFILYLSFSETSALLIEDLVKNPFVLLL